MRRAGQIAPADTGIMTMSVTGLGPWYEVWAVSVPIIVTLLVLHIGGLVVIYGRFIRVFGTFTTRRLVAARFIAGSLILTAITALHAMEAAVWAAAYTMVGAIQQGRYAMLYSLGAITSYGHEVIFLERHWQMMGALEALNGMILFGLTTAFLFAMVQSGGLVRRD
jgi:hypothetical protein